MQITNENVEEVQNKLIGKVIQGVWIGLGCSFGNYIEIEFNDGDSMYIDGDQASFDIKKKET